MLRRMLAAVMGMAMLLGAAPAVRAQEPASAEAIDVTPARLSYAEGGVSFWRPGSDEWAPAQVNTPLAAGDELATGHDGNLELQVAGRAFVRAWGDTRLGLTDQDPGLLRLRVTAGHVAVDLRSVEFGRTIAVDTPHGALTIDQPGYYRADVTAERTTFVARGAGRATLALAGGPATGLAAGETVVLDATGVRRVAAPDLDVWDRWNAARTDTLLAATSARYVPVEVAGVRELDQYGAWSVVPTYGAVWTPARVATGWAPYSTGRWIHDARYGWTWVDLAPWGWAPYHYGRWVVINGVWAWAPGPIVARAVWAPALVVFFGAPGVRVEVGSPFISWVALGWGEPVTPWWGRAGFVGRPWWGGWGGPRVRHVTVYRNVTVVNAVVGVRRDHFGRGPVAAARIRDIDVRRLEPVHGRIGVRHAAERDGADTRRAVRPPDARPARPVVETRRAAETPAPRIVPLPRTVPRAETAKPAIHAPAPDTARRREVERITPPVRVTPPAHVTPPARRTPEPARAAAPSRGPEPRRAAAHPDRDAGHTRPAR